MRPPLGDEERVLQIGRILVENALVHTPRGTAVRLRTARRQRLRPSLTVEDEGPGIPPEHAAHIFERFYRVEGSMASGSGLGLAIAKELAELMGGDVELHVTPAGRSSRLSCQPQRPEPAFSRENGRRVENPRYSDPMRVASCASPLSPPFSAAALAWDREERRLARQGSTTVIVNARARSPRNCPRRRVDGRAVAGKGFDPSADLRQARHRAVTIFAYFGDPASQDQVAQGSGFVISPRGYILTNSHVITNAGESASVRGADKLFVEFSDGDRAEAKIVGWDLYDDVGLVRVDPRRTRCPGAARELVLGGRRRAGCCDRQPARQRELTRGRRRFRGSSLDQGAHRRAYKVVDAIQTDAPITHGNSGGPLLDARGRVIGINAQIRSENGTGNDSGIGFAIPIDAAKNSVAQLIKNGQVTYAYVGITTDNMTPSLAKALGYKVDRGALIVDVNDGSPAAAAHLRGGTRFVNALGLQELKTGAT